MIYARYGTNTFDNPKAVSRMYKVYGYDGHGQSESYNASMILDCSTDDNIRVVETFNADVTGTHDFTLVRITRNSAKECDEEMRGQRYDGIFENCRVGKVVKIKSLFEEAE